ncbi:MAG TPA: metallophosphoesterase, partial [Pyrinomonadaceae bacterium]|nr:metallophosphoesterase [Pyrinomonadaceae bacterium]
MGNLSKVAKYAIDEANSLCIEQVEITLPRLPKKLDGLKIVHLSDIHHSPFTNLDHIARAVLLTTKLNPDVIILTGDYVSHDRKYIAPVAKVLGELRAKYGTYACLGNHDHWTDADAVTKHLNNAGIKVLVNEGIRFEA